MLCVVAGIMPASPMYIPKTFLVAAVILVAGCASVHPKPKPTLIGIDEQFSLETPTAECTLRNARAKAAPQFGTPCIETPAVMFSEVQNTFQSALEENPACAGVVLKTYENAGAMTDGVEWRMKFFVRVQDDGTLSIADSSWEIDPHVPNAQSADGVLGDPYQTAARVCTVVKRNGGKVQ
jgi:hypothetical protein